MNTAHQTEPVRRGHMDTVVGDRTNYLADKKFLNEKLPKHQQPEANDYIYLGAEGITL